MKSRNNKANFIILIIIGLLFLLVIIISIMLQILNNSENKISTENIIISTNIDNKEKKTVEEIIESYGSKFLNREDNIFIETYVNFKYDLFDEIGKSKKQYFYDMIDEIVEIEKDSFYLKDESKKIEIFVTYDKDRDTYEIIINNIENYYDNTDGEIYVNLSKTQITTMSDFAINNNLIIKIINNNTYYAGTELASDERIDLGNGYYSYNDGEILARLQKGKVLNMLFKANYTDEIAVKTCVTTSLEEVYKRFVNLAFGNVKEGYLGYRTENAYVFLYEDEISVYGYQYKANDDFDKYLKEYCETENLEKLYKDFSNEWTNYFEKEYNPETQSLKLTYPTRGIEIDIQENDSRGIKIYNNYYLTDTVKELIKSHKITLETDKDLIHITEMDRRAKSK